jgi:hypothetical protein
MAKPTNVWGVCFMCVKKGADCLRAREEGNDKLCGKDTCIFLEPKTTDKKVHCRACTE